VNVSKAGKPDAEIVGKYVGLQGQTPCRKCKKSEWTLDAEFRLAQGGDRVGIFVVLGNPDEVVNVGTFVCGGCGNRFDRPFYSRAQLAAQEFPAVQLDVRAAEEKGLPRPDQNGH
jgi:hypothetical protein